MSEIKTMDGWQEHAIETSDCSIDTYLKAGDRIAQDMVDYFAEAQPPNILKEDLLQVGAPYDLRQGDDGEKHPTYATFVKDEEGWKYCGPCFAGETVEPDPSLADPDCSFKTPEYEYDTSWGGTEKVQLIVETYEFGNNLYVGLEFFDKEIGFFDFYGDVTVNIETLPPLYAAIDTNNNGPGIVDFLEENDIAAKTELTKESGYCSYPVMVFNPTPLFKANPEKMVEHLLARGIDVETIADLKKKALGDCAKYVGNIGHEPLDQLKKEAKERAAEKNAQHPKNTKLPDLDR